MTPAALERALRALVTQLPELRCGTGTGATLEVALGRIERPDMAAARVMEPGAVAAHPVRAPVEPMCTAFLDGIQESRDVAWSGTIPLVFGRIAAVIRERRERVLHTWGRGASRRAALYGAVGELPRHVRARLEEHFPEVRDVQSDGPSAETHPLRLMQDAANAVKQDREALERELAAAFCAADAGVLYVDGPLPGHEAVLGSPAVLGVVKSHQTLYVKGADLATVLALREGERSSVFAIESRHRATVASWYLRVRDPEGRGPFWGLARLELPLWVFESEGPAVADLRSAWVLAERAPLALPDGRWDTMAYGIRNCEEFLRAVLG